MKKQRNITQARDSGVCGAIAELFAANFFMDQGYHVYRSLSRTGLHDLIITKGNKLETVQVGTGKINPETGTIHFKKNIRTCKSDYLFIYHQLKSVFIDVKSSTPVDIAHDTAQSLLPRPLKFTPKNQSRNIGLGEKTLADTISNSKDDTADENEWRKRFYEEYTGAKSGRRVAFRRAKKALVPKKQETQPITNSSMITQHL
jgi:hypothetical protein